MAEHNATNVLKSLSKKHDVRVVGSNIEILRPWVLNLNGDMLSNPHHIGDIGNGTNGKIDFLVNYCGYYRQFVSKF